MPKTPPRPDRFDDLPEDLRNGSVRIGAHRAENPRVRGGLVLLWSTLATIALIAVGIFGTLIVTGRVTLFPTPSATPSAVQTAEPVLDTGFPVTVLNATPQSGLASALADQIIAAGWSADDVTAGEAGSHDFATTTVFYSDSADEGPARGLAQAIDGAAVELSDAYAALSSDPSVRQLVVVIGLDRTDSGVATATP
ncbi:LytR C-terminal domain-containing protein [Microbacterium sp.]|uniref:LytR C-terminal domain-containing protein n=1 Tax=Microbacterium sp. TaxID=51671 RepID=UPI003C7165E7